MDTVTTLIYRLIWMRIQIQLWFWTAHIYDSLQSTISHAKVRTFHQIRHQSIGDWVHSSDVKSGFFSNPDIHWYNPDNIRISVFPSTEPWMRPRHGRWTTASRPPQDGDSDRRGGKVGPGWRGRLAGTAASRRRSSNQGATELLYRYSTCILAKWAWILS